MELAEAIKTEAFRLGFDAVGITTAEPLEPAHTQAFSRWLQEGCAEGLPYMKRHLGKRFSPPVCLRAPVRSFVLPSITNRLLFPNRLPSPKSLILPYMTITIRLLKNGSIVWLPLFRRG